jgi:hypothetical protein
MSRPRALRRGRRLTRNTRCGLSLCTGSTPRCCSPRSCCFPAPACRPRARRNRRARVAGGVPAAGLLDGDGPAGPHHGLDELLADGLRQQPREVEQHGGLERGAAVDHHARRAAADRADRDLDPCVVRVPDRPRVSRAGFGGGQRTDEVVGIDRERPVVGRRDLRACGASAGAGAEAVAVPPSCRVSAASCCARGTRRPNAWLPTAAATVRDRAGPPPVLPTVTASGRSGASVCPATLESGSTSRSSSGFCTRRRERRRASRVTRGNR